MFPIGRVTSEDFFSAFVVCRSEIKFCFPSVVRLLVMLQAEKQRDGELKKDSELKFTLRKIKI